ncbi:MAG: 3-methylornithine--L-lysine ligase PylC [Methanimicrococcus sp.]|nr:3-methylornithine--L-lysine ligase PylC [Methanimicrococcus sp.]
MTDEKKASSINHAIDSDLVNHSIDSDFPNDYAGKRICLIGGKLQGSEAAYLAKKAGMHVILIDKNSNALVKNICDDFHCFDVTKEKDRFITLSKKVDYMIPTNENEETIAFLESVQKEIQCTLLFDFDAYRVSCNKTISKNYFRKINVPTPDDHPIEPPYFVKPPSESGSIGAQIIETDAELKTVPSDYLIEEYLTGPVVSLEIVGNGREYAVVKETHIHIDDVYDCFKVTPLQYDESYRDIAYRLAKGLSLKGLMDVEAVASQKGWKVLEIDARFPSQTPICVYFSCGVNLLLLLVESFHPAFEPTASLHKVTNPKYIDSYCIFEHFLLKDDRLISGGEHLISAGSNFYPIQTNLESGIEIFECTGDDNYCAYTVISYAKTQQEAEYKKKTAESIILNYKKRQ